MEESSTRQATPWGEGRIAVLAHKERICTWIDQGWSLSKIYKELGDAVGGLSYQGFNRCVRLHLQTGKAPRKKANPSASIPEMPTPAKPKLDLKRFMDPNPLPDSELF